MNAEKPVRVTPNSWSRKHHTETRVFAREIHETDCTQKSCKFYGKPAVQGVCHTTETFCDSPDWSYVDKAIEEGHRFVAEAKKRYKGRELVRYLEACMESYWANEVFRMDELVRMRRNLSLMEHKLARPTKASKNP